MTGTVANTRTSPRRTRTPARHDAVAALVLIATAGLAAGLAAPALAGAAQPVDTSAAVATLSDAAATRWVVTTKDKASLRCGPGAHYYTVTELPQATVLALASTEGEPVSSEWQAVAYPVSAEAFVRADEARVVGDRVELTSASKLRAPNLWVGLSGSWRAIYAQPLPPGTTMTLVGELKGSAGEVAGYRVQPPRPPAVPQMPVGFVSTSDVRPATADEIRAGLLAAGMTPPPTPQPETMASNVPLPENPAAAANPTVPTVRTAAETPDTLIAGSTSQPATQPTTQPATQPATAPTDDLPPVAPPAASAQPTTPPPTAAPIAMTPATPAAGADQGDPTGGADQGDPTGGADQGDPTGGGASPVDPANPAAGATPQPAEVKASTLDTLEAAFARVRAQGTAVEDDALDELIAEFTRTLGTATDPGIRRGVEQRLSWLSLRRDLRNQRRELDRVLADAESRSTATFQQAADVVRRAGRYTVVGRLSASPLYDGVRLPLMYRVVAAEGPYPRTLAYVRPDATEDLSASLGQIVGVAGPSRRDEALGLLLIEPDYVDVLAPTAP